MTDFNIINADLIDFNPPGGSKTEVIGMMSRMLEKCGRINDSEAFIKSVLEREAVSSTDTGIGVAIPHGKGGFVAESSVAICRFNDGLVWDETPVKAVFMLAVDDDEEGLAHLELIAKVSTMLMDDDFLELLFTANSEDLLLNDIYRRLQEDDNLKE